MHISSIILKDKFLLIFIFNIIIFFSLQYTLSRKFSIIFEWTFTAPSIVCVFSQREMMMATVMFLIA